MVSGDQYQAILEWQTKLQGAEGGLEACWEGWADALHQPHFERFRRWNFDAARLFAQAVSLWDRGVLAAARVEVGNYPECNSAVADNNVLLADLPSPFAAEFDPQHGASATDDGRLWWSAPIEMKVGPLRCPKVIQVGPRFHTPLEVGSTHIEQSWVHICRSLGLARWPYGSRHILLMVVPYAKASTVLPTVPYSRGPMVLDWSTPGMEDEW